MDLIWFDRIGIVLTFIAGFLMAPGLIGIDRLRRAETLLNTALMACVFDVFLYRFKVGNCLLRVAEKLQEVEDLITPRWLRRNRVKFPKLDWEVYMREWQEGFAKIGPTKILWGFLIGEVVLALPLLLFGSLMLLINFPPATIAFFALLAVWAFSLVADVFTITLLMLLKAIQWKEGLPGVLLVCGIIFFVVGNLFQLLATFT
jgi:hypothetical protein